MNSRVSGFDDWLNDFLEECAREVDLDVRTYVARAVASQMVADQRRLNRSSIDELMTLRKLGSPLEGHPNMKRLPGIEASTGSLGQGLSMANGIARAALDAAVRYASERKQFGKAINRYQAIQIKLAEMATEIEAATHTVYHAAWLRDNDKPHHKQAAMAKLFASETAARVCDQAARVFASYGYAMEYPAQRFLRDVRFTLIGGGTSEILKLIIAKEISG